MQTQTAAPAQAIEYRDTRKDAKLEKGLRAKIRLTCITGSQMVPGWEVPQGTHEITVNTRVVSQIREHMLETEPAMWEAAQTQARAAKERARCEATNGAVGRDKDLADSQFEATYTDTPQAAFRRLTGRDLKPFMSLEVLESDIAELVDEEKLATETAHATAIAAAVAKAMAPYLARQQNDQNQKR